jgi:phosphate transport system protein
MLKKILEVLRTRSVMKEVEDELREMLTFGQELYSASAHALIEARAVDFDVYARDQEINRRVIDIRKKIVEHLAVSGSVCITGELVFITLVNDLERIGDYSKNILDLSKATPGGGALPDSRYRTKLAELMPRIERSFELSARAFFDHDKDAAHEVLDVHSATSKTCEGIVSELLRDEGMSSREGIALALSARYFKRVSSHLKNMASSAVNPFSFIGYRSPEEAEAKLGVPQT